MMNRILILLLISVFTLPLSISAQLSEGALDELAKSHADKWALYLNLSKYRKADLKKIWKKHELNKSKLVQHTADIREQLHEENQSFLSNLGEILTPNELEVYKMIEETNFKEGKEYLETLVSAISTDSLFLEAYADLQYNEILPSMMAIRMELEETIKTQDKEIIDSVRAEIFNLYDNCLVTCLASEHKHHKMFEDLDELMIVALNKDLHDQESGLSKLIDLTHKYEESIHNIYIKHKRKFDYWDKRNKHLKEHYILPDYTKSLIDLKKRNGLSTLKHLESDAIFLLIDPYNVHTSRKFLNLGLHNQL